jgi:lipopolysaccharide biosynthesis protein
MRDRYRLRSLSKLTGGRKNKTAEDEERPKPYIYTIDSPKFDKLSDRRLIVKGWLIPTKGQKVLRLRLNNNHHIHELPYGIERLDVAKAHPDIDRNAALKSGFYLEMEFQDGTLDIEVDFGNGFESIHSFILEYTGERPLTYYNPHLATNWAEHVNLLESKAKYFYEDSRTKDFKRDKQDPKLVTFYLPQYHPIPENDATWGKGFTEWTNVTTAQPRFVGHRQPIFPKDLGYYDLRFEENIAEQIKLAKKHGIYGFCFYYYWFSGKRLLEKPLDSFLNHKEWDFNFMICWANENWTKRWDGYDKDVIMAQKYLPADPLNFIKGVEDILLDSRYIHVNNSPVLAVYRASELKNPKQYVKVWRDYFKKKHNKNLHLVSVMGFDTKNPEEYGFDAAIEFVPQGVDFKAHVFEGKKPPRVNITSKLLDVRYEGAVYDYREVSLNKKFHEAKYDFKSYKCVMPSWDNDARKKGKAGAAYSNESPDLYGEWLDVTIKGQALEQESLIFINAWNEWAEGTTLEPTLHYGHALLNRTTEILARNSKSKLNIDNFPLYGMPKSRNKLAVVLHLYYPERWNFIKEKMTNIPGTKWDLFVTLNEKDRDFISIIKEDYPKANIQIMPNRGRDILPFVHLARRLEKNGYKVVLKLHSKKSTHRKDGEKWFNELVTNLLPNKKRVAEILNKLSNEVSIVGPKGHYISLKEYIGSNEQDLRSLISRIYGTQKAQQVMEAVDRYAYFGGSMFWANMEAIKPVLDLHLMVEDFEAEAGQIDGTMAHAVERLLTMLPQISDFQTYSSSNTGLKVLDPAKANRNYKYVK